MPRTTTTKASAKKSSGANRSANGGTKNGSATRHAGSSARSAAATASAKTSGAPVKTSSRKQSGGDPEVAAFLDEFATALTAGDGRAIARMWEVPAFVLGEEAMAVGSRAQVEEFFAGAKNQYNERGVTDTRADIQSLEWATNKIALVTVRWPYLDEDGEEIGAESSTYTLCRDESGDLKFRVALMRGTEESATTGAGAESSRTAAGEADSMVDDEDVDTDDEDDAEYDDDEEEEGR